MEGFERRMTKIGTTVPTIKDIDALINELSDVHPTDEATHEKKSALLNNLLDARLLLEGAKSPASQGRDEAPELGSRHRPDEHGRSAE